MCNKGLNEAFGVKLFNFIQLNLGYFDIYHPIPPAFTCICGNAIRYA